jgi:hypothetical protein
MKYILYVLIGIVTTFPFSFVSIAQNALDTELNQIKKECKERIEPARFEGSRFTYFKPTNKSQFKSVEVFLILNAEYIFALSTKAATSPVSLRIYDSNDAATRVLIYEQKIIENKTITLNSKDLVELYFKKNPKATRLKNLIFEYEFAKGQSKNGGVVLVIGSK